MHIQNPFKKHQEREGEEEAENEREERQTDTDRQRDRNRERERERLLLGDSGGVVNSLDFCLASLKSLGWFYFRCVLSSQWNWIANSRILHSQL